MSIKIITNTNQDGWKNIPGTGTRRNPPTCSCQCSSWKDHWQEYSGLSWPNTCQVKGCNGEATCGGHVWRLKDGKTEWIAPMCNSCNSSYNTDEFSFKKNAVLVSVV